MFVTIARAIVRRSDTWYSGSLRTASGRDGDFAEVLIVPNGRLTASTKCVAGRRWRASNLSR
jgi:hypothetical protein